MVYGMNQSIEQAHNRTDPAGSIIDKDRSEVGSLIFQNLTLTPLSDNPGLGIAPPCPTLSGYQNPLDWSSTQKFFVTWLSCHSLFCWHAGVPPGAGSFICKLLRAGLSSPLSYSSSRRLVGVCFPAARLDASMPGMGVFSSLDTAAWKQSAGVMQPAPPLKRKPTVRNLTTDFAGK